MKEMFCFDVRLKYPKYLLFKKIYLTLFGLSKIMLIAQKTP